MKIGVLPVLAIVGLATATAWSYQTNYDGGTWMNGPVRVSVDVSGATAEGSADPAALREAVKAAATKWNEALGLPLLRVALAPLSAHADDNGRNELLFSSQISSTSEFAAQFGSVAIRRDASGRLVECDLVFNPIHRWLVYRGPLQRETNGDRVPDLYRVALHEFGHLLGLVHPDSDAQFTIMRSAMSDVDDLTPRDVADGGHVADALLDWNRPRIASPADPRTTTGLRAFRLRGAAAPFFTPAITLKITSGGRTRNVVLHLAKSWKKTVALARGRNRLQFFYRTPNGRLTRFAVRTIVRR